MHVWVSVSVCVCLRVCVFFLKSWVPKMCVFSSIMRWGAEPASLNGPALLTRLIVERLQIELHYDAPC